MSSVIDVCNVALALTGDKPITSLTDGTPTANDCGQNYESVRNFVFGIHPWNCLIKSTSLSASTTEPATLDYDYQYLLPADCARVLNVDTTGQWRIEQRYILTNEAAPLYIRYVQVVEDPASWDVRLREVVSHALAVRLSERRSQSTNKKRELKDDFKNVLRMAVRADAQEGSTPTLVEDDWLTVRGTTWSSQDWAT